MKKALLALCTFVIVSANAQSTWKLDKNHSQVNFTVSHMVFSEVSGAFKDFDITFDAAKDDFTDARIAATIKTGSIDTQNESRDKHVKSDDFLNVEKYPEMKFMSTKIEETGKDTYNIIGDLTIRDVTKPVTLNTKYKGSIKDTRGNTRIAFKATTTINRFEFGTKWNRELDSGGLIAGKEIEITLIIELVKQNPQQNNSTK
ncbi:MAG: YceI family protein [bacterium]